MSITLIWAMDQHRLIGKNHTMPWRLPNDMVYFRNMTQGKTVVMGRKTFDSLNGALPKRRNVVVTRNRQWQAAGVETLYHMDEVRLLAQQQELMIIGGAQIYKQLMPDANKLLVTYIDDTFDGDTYFPAYEETQWKSVSDIQGVVDERNPYRHRFVTYVRYPQ